MTSFYHMSFVLVTCFVNFAAIVLLRTVKAKERVKILLATLLDTTQWPCQFYKAPLKVKVAFDLYMEPESLAYKLRKAIRIYSLQGKN